MIYNLLLSSNAFKGAFVYDKDFGIFFLTEVLTSPFKIPEAFSLKATADGLKIVEGGLYHYHLVRLTEGYRYLFYKEDMVMDSFNYLTMDDLGFNSEFKLFTGGEFLEALASLCTLPTGNFICGSVQDYITIIERMVNTHPNKEYFLRGHYYYKYELIPSLYRRRKYSDNESYMYMDFKTQFYNELANKKYIEILTTMQHYKMPTRLLDTTSNPLVALYMACDKPINYKNKNYGIGEVIFMGEDKKNVKYSDSNAVTLLSSLAVLETVYKDELYHKIKESLDKNDPSIYKNSLAYKRFKAEVETALPSFSEELFDPQVLLKPRHVKVGMINERIIAQSGSFILFGLRDYKTGEGVKLDTISKERIFIVNRPYISKQLLMLNLNPGTMYPDKDHMSQSISKAYE